jgi:hypothetical protein
MDESRTPLEFVEHFVSHAKPSKERPAVLLSDSHDSHLSISALDCCEDNGVIALCFPPHFRHKLQSLDRSIYGPLKTYVKGACDTWITNHPGQTMTVYGLPGIVNSSLHLAATSANITAEFKVTGIYPCNRDVFTEKEYLPSYVMDRQVPQTNMAA